MQPQSNNITVGYTNGENFISHESIEQTNAGVCAELDDNYFPVSESGTVYGFDGSNLGQVNDNVQQQINQKH